MRKLADAALGYVPGMFLGGISGLAFSLAMNAPAEHCGDIADQLVFVEETRRPMEALQVRSERLDGECVFTIETADRVHILNKDAALLRIRSLLKEATK